MGGKEGERRTPLREKGEKGLEKIHQDLSGIAQEILNYFFAKKK